jgi:hypothetical protein
VKQKAAYEESFYRFFPKEHRKGETARVYVNPQAGDALKAMKIVVDEIVEKSPSVVFAKIDGPAALGKRTDAIVIYVMDTDKKGLENAKEIAAALGHLLSKNAIALRGRGVPLMTHMVQDGISIAANPVINTTVRAACLSGPAADISFGQHRCCAIAIGITMDVPLKARRCMSKTMASLKSESKVQSRVDALLQTFGIDPKEPYKNSSKPEPEKCD